MVPVRGCWRGVAEGVAVMGCSRMLERCRGGCQCHGACLRMLERLSGAAVLLDRGFRKSQDVGSPPVGRNVSIYIYIYVCMYVNNIVSKFSIKPNIPVPRSEGSRAACLFRVQAQRRCQLKWQMWLVCNCNLTTRFAFHSC